MFQRKIEPSLPLDAKIPPLLLLEEGKEEAEEEEDDEEEEEFGGPAFVATQVTLTPVP